MEEWQKEKMWRERDNLFRSLALPFCLCLCLFAFCGATLKAKNDAVRTPIGHRSEVC